MRHEHASLALAQRCSGVAAPAPLFSSLLNYRHSPRELEQSQRAILAWEGIESLDAEERTNYPLALTVDDLGDGFALTAQAVTPIDPGPNLRVHADGAGTSGRGAGEGARDGGESH